MCVCADIMLNLLLIYARESIIQSPELLISADRLVMKKRAQKPRRNTP